MPKSNDILFAQPTAAGARSPWSQLNQQNGRDATGLLPTTSAAQQLWRAARQRRQVFVYGNERGAYIGANHPREGNNVMSTSSKALVLTLWPGPSSGSAQSNFEGFEQGE